MTMEGESWALGPEEDAGFDLSSLSFRCMALYYLGLRAHSSRVILDESFLKPQFLTFFWPENAGARNCRGHCQRRDKSEHPRQGGLRRGRSGVTT